MEGNYTLATNAGTVLIYIIYTHNFFLTHDPMYKLKKKMSRAN